ncbi:hypothetical protein Ancab_010317 [Ancistrocladus abbreviatus]
MSPLCSLNSQSHAPPLPFPPTLSHSSFSLKSQNPHLRPQPSTFTLNLLSQTCVCLSLSLSLTHSSSPPRPALPYQYIRSGIRNQVICHRGMLERQGNPSIGKSTGLPQRHFYRARAHSNPLSDSHFPVPLSPTQVDYSLHFPQFFPSSSENGADIKKVEFADAGSGFGGLLISLSTLFPDKVTEYVKEQILALRNTHPV